ncbi:MAG: tripartite tricarboxylate transporter substrate binding protein [Burkholderiaceae bacterium]
MHHFSTPRSFHWVNAARATPTRHRLRLIAAVAIASVVSLPLQAQTSGAGNYPDRPVRLIVSYAAGNVTDTLARIVSDKLSTQWGQAVTVDNRPGQGGSIGAQTAVKAPADGYTLLFSAMAAMAVNPHVYSNVGYDVRKDFAPIINVAYPDGLIVATPALQIQTLKALVDYSKKNPTALNYGTAGNGTVPHLNMEAIKEMTGLVAQHVPYKSASAVLTDVMGGRLQLQGESVAVLLPQIKAGKLIPIAATSLKRLPQLPDLPTVGETVPGYVPVVPWLGIFAPVGTPPAIIAKVSQDVSAILRMPDVQEKFTTFGLTTSGDGPQAFAKTINNDYERLGKLVKQLGLKVD